MFDFEKLLLWLSKILELGFVGYILIILIFSIGIIFITTCRYQHLKFWEKNSERYEENRLFLLNQMRDETQNVRDNLAHHLDKIADTVGFYRKFLFQFLDIMDRIWGKPVSAPEQTPKFSNYLTIYSLDRCLSFAIIYPIVISITIWLFTTQPLKIAGITFIEKSPTFIQTILGIILLIIATWSYYKHINKYTKTKSIKKSLLYIFILSIIGNFISNFSNIPFLCIFNIIALISAGAICNNIIIHNSITHIIYDKNISIIRQLGNIFGPIWAILNGVSTNAIAYSVFFTIFYSSYNVILNYGHTYSSYIYECIFSFYEIIFTYLLIYPSKILSYSFPKIDIIFLYVSIFFTSFFSLITTIIIILVILMIISCTPAFISVIINYNNIIKNNKQKIYHLYLLFILIFSGVVVYIISSDNKKYVFYVLFVLLPIINAYFDWVSISATRYFLQKSLITKEKAFENTFYDIGIALLCAIGVTSSTIGAIFLYNHLTGREIFDIMNHVKALSSLTPDNFAEKFKSHGWMIVCFYSTFLPTIVHLGFMLTSFLGTTKLTIDFKDLAKKIRQGYFQKTQLEPSGKNDPCEYVDDFTLYFNMNTLEPEIQLRKITNILWLHWVIVACIVILSFYGIFVYITPYLFKVFI